MVSVGSEITVSSARRLLEECGYKYARVVQLLFENGEFVVLFTIPHKGKRAAFTAFIEDTVDYGIGIEVFKGFVTEKGKVS